jgi:outer membrane protein OmpA-like peptidoglycan-associated protein
VLEVRGELNPLAMPPALDITARAHDIELAPLSPYAGKYAGYAIERGKLSMNVHYRVQPDGRLTATNQVVLNQLTFGDRVDSPSATKLPVLFAVALLKDRNGNIDVDLPIGGSINDPEFSVGGLVWKLILNLLERAITAPFSLLAGSGERDLSQVLFVPGTAQLEEGAAQTLDKVAQALQERPAVQLTITGLADADQERADLQAANLEARLVGLRRTELLQAGDTAVPDAPAVGPEDRARLVGRLYADTRLPDKPRNVLGVAKDVPQAEMEARLRTGLPLPGDAARALAVRRAAVVRDALGARGLPNERMFMASPKVHGAGSAEPGAWLPHVQLELSSR